MLNISSLYDSMLKFYGIRKSEFGKFTYDEAKLIGEIIGINWDTTIFTIEDFRQGLEVELEHGLENPITNVTNNNLILTGKIALAHLNEFPDYYERLEKLENEAKAYWESR